VRPAPTTSIRAPPTDPKPYLSRKASSRKHHDQLYAVRHSDWQTIVADIKKFGSAGKNTAVVSTINATQRSVLQGIATRVSSNRHSGVAFSVVKKNSRHRHQPLLGHSLPGILQSIKSPRTRSYQAWQPTQESETRTRSDEAHVIGFDMWVKASRGQSCRRQVIDALRAPSKKSDRGTSRCFEPSHTSRVHRRNQRQRPVRRVWKTRAGGRR